MFSFYATVVFAGIVNIACYALVCRKLGSWMNCFTLIFAQSIFIDIFLGYTSLRLFGSRSSLGAYIFCYSIYMISAMTIAAVALFARPPKLAWLPAPRKVDIRFTPWIILLSSYLVYLPVLIRFSAYILSPRDIYTQTRVGYGGLFFLSTFLCNLAFILYLFKKSRTRVGAVFFFTLCGIILLLHGSKGEVILLVILYLVFQVHVLHKRYSMKRAFTVGGIVMTLVASVFFVFGKLENVSDLLDYMTAFSDYTYNATRVIDAPPPQYPYLGQLVLEELVYSRVPRFIYPQKPYVWGALRLPAYYDPVAFELQTGAGSFGIGEPYADFGPLILIILPLSAGFGAYFTMGLIYRLRYQPTPGGLIMLLYLCGMSIVPVNAITLLPELLLLAFAVDEFVSHSWSIEFV